MDLNRALASAGRWWPAPIALLVLVANLLTWYSDPLRLVAILVVCVGLALSRAKPLLSFAITGVGALLAPAVGSTSGGWALLTLALAAGLVAAWGVEPLGRRAVLGVPVGVVALVSISLLAGSGSVNQWEGVFAWVLAVLAWSAVVGGRALRDFVRAESAEQQAIARTTVVESELRDERLRADLTHDFHDVMAHSLAVLAAQAEGLRLTHAAHPERIGPVLTTISDTARLALVEVRQLLERVDDDARRPQPTSADIPGLVAQMRSAGPDVSLHDIGTPGRLSRVADIAAYRIVQESLTNALRHGGPAVDIAVTLTRTGPGLSITVTSPIRDRAALGPAGRGIAGMQERARLAGGSFEIDAESDRFAVSAYLPYAPVSHAPTAPLTEDELATLPVPRQPRPEEVVAPWIVEATRRYQERHPVQSGTAPDDSRGDEVGGAAAPRDARPIGAWSLATAVDLTLRPGPEERIRNPMAKPEPERAP